MLKSKNDLAILYKEQGDYSSTKPLPIKAVKGRRLKLVGTHPHTVESLNNIIELYQVWVKRKILTRNFNYHSRIPTVDEQLSYSAKAALIERVKELTYLYGTAQIA